MYRTGDYVYPTDLPHRFLCRVTEAERFDVTTGPAQILRLAPLEGPWPEGTRLVRPDVWVRPATRQDHVRRVRVRPRRPTGGVTSLVASGHGEAA